MLDHSSTPNQLILLLKEKKDWEIFLVLCNDLINVMKEHDEDIIVKVMKRLRTLAEIASKKDSGSNV